MAGAGGGMAVLPQYQGDYYTLQRQQALAQALAQQATTPQQIQATGSGPYTVMPKYNIGAGLSQLGEALLAAKLGNQVSQGYQQLGAGQAQAFGFGGGQPQQAAPQQGMGTTPNPFSGGQGGSPDGSGASGAPATMVSPQSNVSPMNPLGLPPALAYSAYASDPAKYAEMQAAAYKPADVVSQIRAAGIDPNSPLGKQMAQTALANTLAPKYSNARGGGYMVNDTTGAIEQLPQVPEGYQAIKGADNQWHVVPVEGGVGALKTSAAAGSIGKAYGNVTTGYNGTQPVFVNQGALADQTAGGGQPGAAPQAGAVNPGRFGGYQAPGSGPVAPALAPGVAGAAEKVSGASADRYNQAVQFGVDSPTRQNVLDNVIDLSKSGVQSGPGADWQNKAIGLISNTPLLSQLPGMAKAQDNVAKFQELQKFLNQNGLRAWQAAGGSGTDAQLDAAMHANPNDKMFPQALQQVAAWAKAGELAGTARANFLQQFKNNNAGSVANLDQAEQTWRNNFDPKIFQLQTYSPDQQKTLLNSLTPTQAQQLMTKRAWFKQNGLL